MDDVVRDVGVEVWYVTSDPAEAGLAALAGMAGAVTVPFTLPILQSDIDGCFAHGTKPEIWLIGPGWRARVPYIIGAHGLDDDVVVFDDREPYGSTRALVWQFPINPASGFLGYLISEPWPKPEFRAVCKQPRVLDLIHRLDAYMDSDYMDSLMVGGRYYERFSEIYRGEAPMPGLAKVPTPVSVQGVKPSADTGYQMQIRDGDSIITINDGRSAQGYTITVSKHLISPSPAHP